MLYEVSWRDLVFETLAPVEFYSTKGVLQRLWEPVGMPKIPHEIVRAAFYLYEDKASASAGKNPGGTGFIIQYRGRRNEGVYAPQYYAVTNWHVACKNGCSVIRLNTQDGGTDIIELGPEEWHFLPGKQDIALVPINLDQKIHEVAAIGTQMFLTEEAQERVGVGEDVFMVGLFVDHGGADRNIPSARFGNVSMLPNDKARIEQPTGYRGLSYILDLHSRTGFSGSPVFAYRTFGSDLAAHGHEIEELRIEDHSRPSVRIGGRGAYLRARNMFVFLGVHWGQFPEKWELRERQDLSEAHKNSLVLDGSYVEGMSGMTCVIPAWQIWDLLDMPEVKKPRDKLLAAAKADFDEKMRQYRSKPRAESASPPSTDANPNHREDFTRLVGAAARKPEPKD
ncbi:MAG: serine protease [Variibacter sp.]